MANRYSSTITIQRTGAATWVVYRKGVNVSGNLTSRVAAESIAAGLASSAVQEERVGDRKAAANERQVITLNDFSGSDSFSLQYKDLETVAFVGAANCAASDLQAALRTATGDSTLTVTGTTNQGPFTVNWASSTQPQPLLQQGAVSGCTITVTRSITGGVGF